MLTQRLTLGCCLILLLASCGSLPPVNVGGRRPPVGPGGPPGDPTAFIRADIVDHAKELIGTRYKFGGNKPSQGFDCSGFVLYLYQNAGIDIERVSRQQAKQGRRIDPERARPGDLVFFRRPGKPVHHVSVIVEANADQLIVVHATTSRGVVREDVYSSAYWKNIIYQTRDILE